MERSLGSAPGAGCPHKPPCPDADASDRHAAHVIASHPEQGWILLCNGIVIFDDGGELLLDVRGQAGTAGPLAHSGTR